MNRRIVLKLGQATALATLLALASGCQDLNSLVTGEKFRRVPEGSPRVEVEVDFVVHDTFYASLADVDAKALEAQMEKVALSLADIGLRFYPVSADAYGSGDKRPERRMLVEVSELELAIDEETVEEKDQPLRVVARVAGVTCLVRARVEKSRTNGPPLVVGSGEARGRVRPGAAADELAGAPTYGVRADVAGHEGLRVEEQDLLDAFEEGAIDALRAVVKAVDRELTAAGSVN